MVDGLREFLARLRPSTARERIIMFAMNYCGQPILASRSVGTTAFEIDEGLMEVYGLLDEDSTWSGLLYGCIARCGRCFCSSQKCVLVACSVMISRN